MRPERFVDHTYGAPYRDPTSGWSFWAFRPASIPRDLRLDPETVLALSEADAALGRLAGAGRHLPDPSVVVRPYIMREALASSRIEGTQASLSDVFQAVAAEEESPNPDILEVFNYMRAMDYGLGLAPNLPLVGRMVREIHEQLVTGVRGEGRRPGEFRREPVWIGSPTDDPETATFVPPLPAELNAAWSDWEAFANEGPRLPHLVQCALMHYQFETIHPFFDGNGRLGRLLIVFFLIHRAALPAPLLYISPYFEDRRGEYYDRLQAVRERGEMQEWLQFFFTAVSVQAETAIIQAEELHDLRERYRHEMAGSRSRAVEVVDLLFGNPIITVSRVGGRLGITPQGAIRLIRQLEEKGWLASMGSWGRGGRLYWIANEIYGIVSGPPRRARSAAQTDATRA